MGGRWLNAQIHGILQGAASDPRPKFIFAHCNFVAIFKSIFILFFVMANLFWVMGAELKVLFFCLFSQCNFFSFLFFPTRWALVINFVACHSCLVNLFCLLFSQIIAIQFDFHSLEIVLANNYNSLNTARLN